MNALINYSTLLDDMAIKIMRDICEKLPVTLGQLVAKAIDIEKYFTEDYKIDSEAVTADIVKTLEGRVFVFNNKETKLNGLEALITVVYDLSNESPTGRLVVEMLINGRLVGIINGQGGSNELEYHLVTSESGALDMTIAEILLVNAAIANLKT